MAQNAIRRVMARIVVGAGRWMAIVAVGLMVFSFFSAPGANAAGPVLPCPKSSGSTPGTASVLGSVPKPLNPCPSGEWAATLGTGDWEMSVSVEAAANGGFVWLVANGSYDTLARFDTQGALMWQKLYNCGGGASRRSTIRQTADGGFAFATSTNGCALFGGTDAIVYKLDGLGEIVWQKAYGTAGTDEPRALIPASDGGFLLVGFTPGSGAGSNAWVVRLDTVGAILWQKAIGGGAYATLWSGASTADGGFIVGGNELVIKFDAAGNVQWKKNYRGANVVYSIRALPGGDYVAAGLYGSNPKAFAMKLDANGAIVWQKSYGVAYPGYGNSITETSNGGFLLTWTKTVGNGGSANLDIEAAKLDASGNVQWAKTYGGPGRDWACSTECARELGDGFLLIAGATYSFGAGDQDAWLLSLAPDGSISPTCPSGVGKSASVSASNPKFGASSSTLAETAAQAASGATGATASPNSLVVMMQCSS